VDLADFIQPVASREWSADVPAGAELIAPGGTASWQPVGC